MPIHDDPAEPAATSLSFDLEVHKGRTKTSFRIKERGTLKIKNKSLDRALRIESDDDPAPFIVEDCTNPQSGFTVNADSKMNVTIAEAYVAGMRFTFTSTIDGSIADDPIVIIERR
jgi:hypothetical protein